MEIIIYFITIILIITIAIFIAAGLEKHITSIFAPNFKRKKISGKELMQILADGIKLLIKEDCAPKGRKKILFFMAPLMVICPIVSAFCLISFNEFYTQLNDAPTIILFLAMISIPFIGRFLAGYSSNNKFSLISSVKIIIQSISCAIPMGMSLFAVCFQAGTLNLNELIQAQNGATWLFSWNFIPQIIGSAVFFTSTLILLNNAPFNLTNSENAPIPEYTTEYSGLKFAFFLYSEYALLFLISIFFVSLYFGGYLSPFGAYVLPAFMLPFEQFFWIILKAFFTIFFIILIKITLPKVKSERLLDFSYKILIPLSLINLNITILIRYFTGAN